MANYESVMRSNYFAVKDENVMNRFCERWGLKKITSHPTGQTLFGFIEDSIPEEPVLDPEELEEDYVADFLGEISEMLVDGYVAIIMEGGREALRYITGDAIAINSKGETREIHIQDIHKLAKQLGDHGTACQY